MDLREAFGGENNNNQNNSTSNDVVNEESSGTQQEVLMDDNYGHEQQMQAAVAESSKTVAVLTDLINQKTEEEKKAVEAVENGEVEPVVVENSTYDSLVEKKPAKKLSSEAEKDGDELNMDEFLPGYGDEDEEEPEEETDNKEEEKKKKTAEDFDFDSMPEVKLEAGELGKDLFRTKIVSPVVVKTDNPKLKSVGDQAFENAVNKLKKRTYPTVNAPMVNSGFNAEVVGGGIVDLLMIYSNAEDKPEIEYELEKMKAMLRAVVGTNPAINSRDLAAAIHYVDYQMLSFAYVCGTLDEVTVPHTCDDKDCKTDFKISGSPREMVLNLDELKDKISALNDVTAENFKDASLLGKYDDYTFDNGVKFVIGHPSYIDMIGLLNNVKKVVAEHPTDGRNYSKLLPMMMFIRQAVLPDGTFTTNGYQAYKALSLLNTNQFDSLKDGIKKVSESITNLKFGIKSVCCPKCGKEHKDIEIASLDELVFLHIMVTRQNK